MNEKSFQELVELLNKLGIDDISEHQITALEEMWHQTPEVIMSQGSLNKLTLLLSYVGKGHYDFKNALWTPTSKYIFSFDMKADDIENMYQRLFQGIASISQDELQFKKISEMSNSEIGIGNQVISFNLNGRHHEFEARINFDWYDVNIISFLNKLAKEDAHTKHLFFLTDGYQTCIVFYNDDLWAERFEEVTQLVLSK